MNHLGSAVDSEKLADRQWCFPLCLVPNSLWCSCVGVKPQSRAGKQLTLLSNCFGNTSFHLPSMPFPWNVCRVDDTLAHCQRHTVLLNSAPFLLAITSLPLYEKYVCTVHFLQLHFDHNCKKLRHLWNALGHVKPITHQICTCIFVFTPNTQLLYKIHTLCICKQTNKNWHRHLWVLVMPSMKVNLHHHNNLAQTALHSGQREGNPVRQECWQEFLADTETTHTRPDLPYINVRSQSANFPLNHVGLTLRAWLNAQNYHQWSTSDPITQANIMKVKT